MADRLWLYTIYERPADFPDSFVIRAWTVENELPVAHDIIGMAPTLEEARALIPAGHRRIDRMQDDDAVIVESWL